MHKQAMKEFFLKQTNRLADLFLTPTSNAFLQFFRYVFVGGVATGVDWSILFTVTEYAHIHYMLSAVAGFLAGLITNFILSKWLVFNPQATQARVKPAAEFISYALIGLIGLGLTELILFLLADVFKIYYMLAKAVATLLVLFYNYGARKFLLYK